MGEEKGRKARRREGGTLCMASRSLPDGKQVTDRGMNW